MKSLQIAIYESLNHFTPTGLGWYEGFKNLGHDPSILQSQYNINDFNINSPDLLILLDKFKIQDLIKFKQENPKTKIVVVFFGFQDYFLQIKDIVDLWVETVIQHSSVEEKFKQKNLPLLLIPLAASKNKFYKKELSKKYDVSFIGQFGVTGHGYREQDKFLFPVIDKEYKGYYAGFSYNNITYPSIHHDLINGIYNETKINLNFHYTYQKEQNINDLLTRLDFNGRVYEIALSGNFQICDHPKTLDIFNNTIPYIKSLNWLDTIDYYLSNDKLANELALEAQNICFKYHTWDNRMQTLINNLF